MTGRPWHEPIRKGACEQLIVAQGSAKNPHAQRSSPPVMAPTPGSERVVGAPGVTISPWMVGVTGAMARRRVTMAMTASASAARPSSAASSASHRPNAGVML